ncbi:hypothetical protein [Sulfodiicoccus acidiphilus]|nr:hypothetical protein [Sulfodiicoccus acidiphilus]
MMVVEGVLAETAYHGYIRTLEELKTMPTLLSMIRNVMRDESRHIAFGTYLISRLVSQYGDRALETFMKRMEEMTPLALGVVQGFFQGYEQAPSGIADPKEYINYALSV